ncbi:MAG: hypothetical protein ACREH3_19930, partial [Geminicoccales bacterium]
LLGLLEAELLAVQHDLLALELHFLALEAHAGLLAPEVGLLALGRGPPELRPLALHLDGVALLLHLAAPVAGAELLVRPLEGRDALADAAERRRGAIVDLGDDVDPVDLSRAHRPVGLSSTPAPRGPLLKRLPQPLRFVRLRF